MKLRTRTIELIAGMCCVLMLVAGCLMLMGCDGDGLFIPQKKVVIEGGDQPGSGDAEEEEPEETPGDTKALGTWLTTYSDDRIETGARKNLLKYAASLKLRRSGTKVSGSGTVFRLFKVGTTQFEKLTIGVSGTISGDDITLLVDSATGGAVFDIPVWQFRIAGRYMVGTYAAIDFDGREVRSGHAVWHKLSKTDIDGTWVSAFTDAYGSKAYPATDRTATLILNANADTGALTGTGNFIEQRDGDAPLDVGFNVVDGEATDTQAEFSLGGLDLVRSEMDWHAFFSTGMMVGAYTQFNEFGLRVHYGTATWYPSPDLGPEAVQYKWMTAFSDSTVAKGEQKCDYIVRANLKAEENNVVSGSGDVLILRNGAAESHDLKVQNAMIVGSHLTMDLEIGSTKEVLSWDLRLADKILVGSYQRLDAGGDFVGCGAAEWRRGSKADAGKLAGTWVASYYDTYSATDDETVQFAMFTVNEPPEDSDAITGFGALRYAGESGRRLFSLGDAETDEYNIRWEWYGPDLFGDTRWYLRRVAGNILVGAYVNENSAGRVESQGSAFWYKTSKSSSF